MFRQKMLDILQQEIDGNWIIPCHFGLSIPEVHTQTFIVRSLVVFVWFVVVFCSADVSDEGKSLIFEYGGCPRAMSPLCLGPGQNQQTIETYHLQIQTWNPDHQHLLMSLGLWVCGMFQEFVGIFFVACHQSINRSKDSQPVYEAVDRSIDQSIKPSIIYWIICTECKKVTQFTLQRAEVKVTGISTTMWCLRT